MFEVINHKVQQILDPGQDHFTATQAAILCLIAYIFGVVMRSFYLWTALDIPATLLNGVPMISTEDGYLFASFVKAHLFDDVVDPAMPFIATNGFGIITMLTYLLVQITSFDLEQVAVFVPMIFAPLLAIPLLYAGRWMGSTAIGFCAALIGTIALPYLKRTSFSYYDTDLFAVTAPAMIVALGIYAVRNPGIIQVSLVSIMALATSWLDKLVIANAILLPFLILYVAFNYKHPKLAQHLIIISIGFLATKIWYLQMLDVVLYAAGIYAIDYGLEYARTKYSLEERYKYFNRGVSLVWWAAAAYMLWFAYRQSPAFSLISTYLSIFGTSGRGVGLTAAGFETNPLVPWNFYQVTGTIVEARALDLLGLSREVGGSSLLFWIGLSGSIIALFRFPVLAVGGTFIAIGIFALEGGVRFGLYLTPIIAIGSAYLAVLAGRYVHTLLKERVKFLNYVVALVLTCVFFYPGAQLAYGYQPRTVAQLGQVEMLRALDPMSSSNDFIISWWDYGYVMRFYANMRTLLDGGKHAEDNYIVSKAFASTSQRLAGNILRESVEAYAAGESGKAINAVLGSRREGFDPTSFVNSMASPNYVLQREKTRDIYLYVPYQMLPIYGVVRYFSDLDLSSGELQRAPLIASRNYRVDTENQRILLPNNMIVDAANGVVIESGNIAGRINAIYTHTVDNNGQTVMQANNINSLGYYHVILAPYYGIVYVMSPEVFRSNFIQMFFFNNHDPNVFELLGRNSLASVYRLRL